MKINSHQSYENIFALIMGIAVLGLMFPYGFPLYIPIIMVFFCYSFVQNRIGIKVNFGIILFMATMLIYCIALLVNDGYLFENNISDLTNILSFVFLITSIGYLNFKEYKNIKRKFHYIVAISAISVSLLSLIKFYLLLNNHRINFLYRGDYYPVGTSLMPDYNMFSLGLLLGVISIIYILKIRKNSFSYVLLILSLLPISISIVFSSSRRGLLVLSVILFILLILIIIKAFSSSFIRNKVFLFFIPVIILLICISPFINIDMNYSNNFLLELILDRSFSLSNFMESLTSRTVRWDISYKILNDYSALQLFWGNGFEYLSILGNYFNLGNEEYPHNLLLSTLLYSGFFGLIIVSVLLLYPFNKILKRENFSEIDIFSMFLICLIFFSVSGNSIFSSEIFGLLLIFIIYIPKVRE